MSDKPTLADVKYTPTQRRIMDILSDGMPHPKEEIQETFYDPMAVSGAVRTHISYLRKKIEPTGFGILIEYVNHGICYRLVQFVEHVKTHRLYHPKTDET